MNKRVSVYESRYKDQAAVTIESEVLKALFLPSIGAKMSSLVYKPLEYELLVQRPGSTYLLQPYDGDYVAGECSGFDDMLPTIDACFYQSYPWKGAPMPDHGEVWSLPWDCRVEEDHVYFGTHGVRFPYRLEKSVSFGAPSTLHIAYRLMNLSAFDFDFMWAAHTMFNLEEGVELVLPAGVRQVVTRLSFEGGMGEYGDEFTWPAFTLADGTQRDLRWLRPKHTRDADKYFVKGRMPEGWCALKYHHSDFILALSWPVEQVPYLGILSNEGGWQDLYNIFLEPCTASFDDLNVAKVRGQCSVVKAGASYEWHLDIDLLPGGAPMKPL
ncbi:MAG: hypothetical protein M1546_05305 [Chloroflexi bacterium]|nr:hypothetical protein [Chloroflexota bacterium]